MTLSVIIVAYNSNDVLVDCLKSIHQYNPFGKMLEVIIVDNKPTTGLQRLLQKNEYGFSLRYIANERNGGFGQGNNVGVCHSSSENIMFLNPDTLLQNNDALIDTVRILNHECNAVIGYTLVDTHHRATDSYSYFFELYKLFPLFSLIKRLSFYAVNRYQCLNRRAWPWGAAFSVKRDAFIKAGAFDEKMFLCNEEPDLMKRMSQRHLHILHHEIVHLEGHGREVPTERYLESFRSLKYYFSKHSIKANGYWNYLKLILKVKKLLGRQQANQEKALRIFENEK